MHSLCGSNITTGGCSIGWLTFADDTVPSLMLQKVICRMHWWMHSFPHGWELMLQRTRDRAFKQISGTSPRQVVPQGCIHNWWDARGWNGIAGDGSNFSVLISRRGKYKCKTCYFQFGFNFSTLTSGRGYWVRIKRIQSEMQLDGMRVPPKNCKGKVQMGNGYL